MRIKSTLVATLAAATLALTACGEGGGGAAPGDTGAGGSGDGGSSDSQNLDFPVATDVNLSDSPTYERAKAADKIVIGVKEDQPELGYLNSATGERSGFDIGIAQWAAASLGFPKDKIEYKAIQSANRESALANGDIDMYVGTYSITDGRKQQVGFAGPYLVTGQGLLVMKDNEDITGPDTMDGKKICSVTGSTPLQNIQENYPKAIPEAFQRYSQCVDALKTGGVDAVTTDEAILLGYAAREPDTLKVVGEPFTEEKYGIGVPKNDTALRQFLDTMLTDGNATWTEIYDATLGKSGQSEEQPKVESY